MTPPPQEVPTSTLWITPLARKTSQNVGRPMGKQNNVVWLVCSAPFCDPLMFKKLIPNNKLTKKLKANKYKFRFLNF